MYVHLDAWRLAVPSYPVHDVGLAACPASIGTNVEIYNARRFVIASVEHV